MKQKNMKSSFLTLSIAGILSFSSLEGVYAGKVELDRGRAPAKSLEDKYLTEVREKRAEFRADIHIRYEGQKVIAVDRNQRGKEIALLDSKGKKFETLDWAVFDAGVAVLEAKGQEKSHALEIYPAGSDMDPEKMGIFKKYEFQQNADGSWNGELVSADLKKFANEWAYADFDRKGDSKAYPMMRFVFPDLDDATVSTLKDGFDNGWFGRQYVRGKYIHDELVPALKSYAGITVEMKDKADGVYKSKEGLTFHKRGQNVTILDSNRQMMWVTDSLEASGFQDFLKDKGIDYVVFGADFHHIGLRGGDLVFSEGAGTADLVAPNPRMDSYDNSGYGFSGVAAGPIAEGSVLRFSDENYKRAQELYDQLLGNVVSRRKMTSEFKA